MALPQIDHDGLCGDLSVLFFILICASLPFLYLFIYLFYTFIILLTNCRAPHHELNTHKVPLPNLQDLASYILSQT